MKKPLFLLLLSLLLSSCSTSFLFPPTPTPAPPTATFTATVYASPTLTPSVTPTQPTPTFTETPTLIYSGPTATPSNTPQPTSTIGLLITEVSAQGTPESGLFTSVQVSGNQIFWGSCKQNFVTFKARVTNPKVQLVTLWLRLQDKNSDESTDWGGGAIMDGDGNGTFTYILTYKNISHYSEFKSAWVQYQLVASDKKLNRIGATRLYLNNISLAPCP